MLCNRIERARVLYVFFAFFSSCVHLNVRNVRETIRTCDQLYQHQAHLQFAPGIVYFTTNAACTCAPRE